MKVLFVNHRQSACGVYEFGRNIGAALGKKPQNFVYRECASSDELHSILKQDQFDAIIYNHHAATLPWLTAEVTRKIKAPQIGIIHEVTQAVADKADNSLFNFHIAHDPTLLLKNPIVFKAGRLVPRYENKFQAPATPTIGSFGFAGKKGQKRIVELVQKEFDAAIVRLNIPFAAFGDANGDWAKRIADECRAALTKPSIKLEITHDFLDESQLLDFIAQNTVNLFLYEAMDEPRGISGATDLALAVQRPFGITKHGMFRHLLGATPSICVEDVSIKELIANGTEPLEPFRREWSEEVLLWDYERIIKQILSAEKIPAITTAPGLVHRGLRRVKRSVKYRLGIAEAAESSSVWIGDTSFKNELPVAAPRNATYRPAEIPADWSLNNILDDKARALFEPTIRQLFDFLPKLMQRKIAAANVQQAFVLDTVYKKAAARKNAKILCVGSFEDSAAEALNLLGFRLEEIDPVLNYDLNAFISKPTARKNSYDIVFSTSVIEHVEDDETFLKHIADLLKPGGVAVLTCDYKDGYKPGDPKPSVDYRFYTQKDFKERLLPKLTGCELVDEPQWDCPNPDFNYDGIDYTFATLVFQKAN